MCELGYETPLNILHYMLLGHRAIQAEVPDTQHSGGMRVKYTLKYKYVLIVQFFFNLWRF